MLIHSPHDLALLVMNHRKKLKLSQADVGNLVGLAQKTISAFENKPENMKLSTLFRIVSALNLDLKVSPKNQLETTSSPWSAEW